ncbi:Na+/H+ antiporter subunit E [Nonomuraea sp. NPDC050328]|uniref:Na+/H+ antiporter subunit E n=1 Tax=Nonomuraea sp. NPDC050328 TaxID=3364361 RepID=UPI0037BD0EE9
MRRLWRRPSGWQVLWLTVVWTALWGHLSLGVVVSGAVVGTLVLVLLPLPSTSLGFRVHPVGLVAFLGGLLWDLARSSLRISWWALRPGPPPDTAIVTVELRSSSETMLMLTTMALSAQPGSLVVDARPGTGRMTLHVLGAGDQPQATAQRDVSRQEALVVGAFGTRTDKEELG